jgi:hypothetical protein
VDVKSLAVIWPSHGGHVGDTPKNLFGRSFEAERLHDLRSCPACFLGLEVVVRLKQSVQLRNELVVESNHASETRSCGDISAKGLSRHL